MCRKYFDDSVREKKTELTKEDSKVLRTIARSYYKNKLERKMQEYVLKASHEKSFWEPEQVTASWENWIPESQLINTILRKPKQQFITIWSMQMKKKRQTVCRKFITA